MGKKLQSEKAEWERREERWQIARAAHAYADSLAANAIAKYIELGMHLNGLRAEYRGDKEFGQARQHYMPELSKSWCSRLMKVARDPRLHTAELQKLSISHLVELSSKDDKIVKQVEESLADGEAPSVRGLREPAPGPDGGPEPGPATTPPTPGPESTETPSEAAPDTGPGPGETSDGQKRAGWAKEEPPPIPREEYLQEVMNLPVEQRMEWARENPMGVEHWVILGLTPDFDIFPAMELIEVVAEYWKQNASGDTEDWIDWAMHRALEEYHDQ